ncbi:hypothetical protein DFH29DRAFT_883362 [Suillus ampliporus]|nr:hypothetical protein DFH29DRAFT_883362 [Suillus ampliporus]
MITQSENLGSLATLSFSTYEVCCGSSSVGRALGERSGAYASARAILDQFLMLRKYKDTTTLDLAALEQAVPYVDEPIGLVYVIAAPAQSAAQEANAGIVIANAHRHKGFGREAIDLVLRWAFEDLNFHRIQAAFMDNAQKDRGMRLFAGQGFAHEGTRRRSVFKPEIGVWDMLRIRGPAASLWDEMFARHAREREEMVKWDEKHNRIRKVSSTQTLRRGEAPRQPDYLFDALASDAESSSSCQTSSYYGSVPPSRAPTPGAAEISQDMLQYLRFVENNRPLQDLDAVSRQSSPSPYNFSIPSTPIPIPPRSPSVASSVTEFDSEDDDDVASSWQGPHRIPTSSASSSSSQLSGPLISISRPGSASGSSESESWSDATDGPDGSDWDMMSEPERSS